MTCSGWAWHPGGSNHTWTLELILYARETGIKWQLQVHVRSKVYLKYCILCTSHKKKPIRVNNVYGHLPLNEKILVWISGYFQWQMERHMHFPEFQEKKTTLQDIYIFGNFLAKTTVPSYNSLNFWLNCLLFGNSTISRLSGNFPSFWIFRMFGRMEMTLWLMSITLITPLY